MKNLIRTLVFLLLSTQAFALSEKELKEEFEFFYYKGKLSSRHCGRNINNFILYLNERGYSTDELHTVHITGERTRWSLGRVMAINSRFGNEIEGNFLENWYFHVVAMFKGKIYDFSFNKTPLILRAKDYLNKMFVPQNPFMPWGSSFRIGGEGPYYTPEIARDEVKFLHFKITKSNGLQTTSVIEPGLYTPEFLDLLF